MKRLNSRDSNRAELEVLECTCGFHLGIDASYVEQVMDVKIICPSCELIFDTAVLCPEDDGKPLDNTPSAVIERVGAEDGWTDESKLRACLDYLDMTGIDKDNFANYLNDCKGLFS